MIALQPKQAAHVGSRHGTLIALPPGLIDVNLQIDIFHVEFGEAENSDLQPGDPAVAEGG